MTKLFRLLSKSGPVDLRALLSSEYNRKNNSHVPVTERMIESWQEENSIGHRHVDNAGKLSDGSRFTLKASLILALHRNYITAYTSERKSANSLDWVDVPLIK